MSPPERRTPIRPRAYDDLLPNAGSESGAPSPQLACGKFHVLKARFFGQFSGEGSDAGRFLPAVAHAGAIPGNIASGNLLIEISLGRVAAIVAVKIFVD